MRKMCDCVMGFKILKILEIKNLFCDHEMIAILLKEHPSL